MIDKNGHISLPLPTYFADKTVEQKEREAQYKREQLEEEDRLRRRRKEEKRRRDDDDDAFHNAFIIGSIMSD